MLSHFLMLPGVYFALPEVDRLRVSAEPAVAEITLQEPGHKLVPLPEIEFRLRIAADCASGGRAESLSITIADTRQTLDEEELQSASAESVDVVMRVPASQLAPLSLGEFCVDPLSEGESVLIASAFVAQASLRCSRDENRSVVFAATPLDIRVDCIHSGATAAEPVDD